MTDEEILHQVEIAEQELKIFIYPILQDSITVKLRDEDTLSHFKIEYLFPRYLSSLANNSKIRDSDHRKHMIVQDPNEANAFIIAHDWMRYRTYDCKNALNIHVNGVIKNVLHDYPYYNRSYGRDHFMMAVYDHGPLCHNNLVCPQYKEDLSWLYRIINTSFIGNYGADRATFYDYDNSTEINEKSSHRYKVSEPCHRSGYDIVVPQLINRDTIDIFYQFKATHIPYREFDSSFTGKTWFGRQVMQTMYESSSESYIKNMTDNYVAECFSNYWEAVPIATNNIDHSLKYRSYFMYCPCGVACWSQRLYEALAVYTIPIVISDEAIQAFERFIDWRTFTVKINTNTWKDNPDAVLAFRQQLRREVDSYRSLLFDCWKSLNISSSFSRGNPYDFIHDRDVENGYMSLLQADPRQHDKLWLSAARIGHKTCAKVLDTMYWKKTEAMERVVPWFEFGSAEYSDIHAFRLLTLEMWCHIKIKSSTSSADHLPLICNHRVDKTARREYF